MRELVISKYEAGQRFDKFLAKYMELAPKSFFYKMMRKKNITLNGKKAAGNEKLEKGDTVKLFLSEETIEGFREKKKRAVHTGAKLDILYEDEQVMLINKPAGMLSQKAEKGDISMVEHLISHLLDTGEVTEEMLKTFRPSLCNRLDRGTEGLVLAAKSYTALRDLNTIIRDDLMKKEYLTITVGAPPQGRFVAWLQHSEKNNKVHIHARESEGCKQIITEVTVIRQAGPFALCRIGLITGRTHQIRAHLAYLGHPVLGDIKYGNRKMNERSGLKTQALCAQRLTFGRIPEENTLHYLSGKVIKLNDPEIIKTFERLTAEK